jgi:hypothetical protein
VAVNPSRAAARIDVSGEWDLRVSFLKGERAHRLTLRQLDGVISGDQNSPQFEGEVTGTIDGDRINLVFRTRTEGTMIVYRLDGSVDGAHITGRVTLGSATDHHQGPINLSQFGTAVFSGSRVGGA